MNKNVFILGIVAALVVGGVVGGTVGYGIAQSKYAAQIEKAKKFFPVMTDVRSISGTVAKVSGNVVTIATQPSPNPFEDWPISRDVVVTDKTKVIKTETKDPKVFQQELSNYQRAAAANKSLPLPAPIKETEVEISVLKEGDAISAEADKDIKTASRFEATRIIVGGSVAVPAGGAAPVVNTPPPPGPGTAPIVNTPPPAR